MSAEIVNLEERTNRFLKRLLALSLALLVLGGAPAAAGKTGPLGYLEGAWSGSGALKLDDGQSERIRCRIEIAVSLGGRKADQSMRCASTSRDVFVQSQITFDGSRLAGTWRNTVSGENGTLAGETNGTSLSVRLTGPAVAALLQAEVKGRRQFIEITGRIGPIVRLSVDLARRGG